MSSESLSTAAAPAAAPSALKVALLAVAGSVLASLTFPVFDHFFVFPLQLGAQPSDQQLAEYNHVQFYFFLKKYSLEIGLLGGVVGLLCGLGKGMRAAVACAVGGAVLGASGGALSWLAVLAINKRIDQGVIIGGVTIEPLMLEIAAQSCIWSLIGLGIGLAFAFDAKNPALGLMGAIGGAIAGFFAAAVRTVVISLIFPSSGNLFVVPPTLSDRLIWAVVGGLFIGGGIVYSIQQRKPKTVG